MKKLVLSSGVVVLAVVIFLLLTNFETAPIHNLPLEGQPMIGNADAEATIVEFGDFMCPDCKDFAQKEFPNIKKELIDTGKAKMYFIDNPFVKPESTYASILGESLLSKDEELFWQFYHQLYAESNLTKQKIVDIAKSLSPTSDFTDLDALEKEVQKDRDFAEQNNINSVPTVFVNGRSVNANFEDIKEAVEKNGN
ncbi:DsbA family protein [Gracilibacillus sp. D59]|uniref:DsbA family protein n=1 Tax=Gracilibacillus sp. D59 TaxID=3457434 RepID=UPI003FCC2953